MEQLARDLRSNWRKTDPEQAWFRGRYERMYQEFCGQASPILQDAVGDLLDAYYCALEGEAWFLFRLGLQMGLELGGLDVLRQNTI